MDTTTERAGLTDVPRPRRFPDMSFSFEEVQWLLHQTRPLGVAERWEQAVRELLEARVAALDVVNESRELQVAKAQAEAWLLRARKAEAERDELAAKLAKRKAS